MAIEIVCRGYLIYQLRNRAVIQSVPVTRNAVSTQAELADNENHSAELAETRHLNSIRASNESIASIFQLNLRTE